MIRCLVVCLTILLGFISVVQAAEIQKITSPKGIDIWLVEDHRLPLLSLAFGFRGGMSLDPPGKAGLAHFVSGVLDEGAGPRDSEAFQAALADNSISLSFSAGRDSFTGSLKTLTQHRDIAAELLHDALSAPHLDPKDIERIRDEISSQIKQNMSDPNWVAQRNFNNSVFHNHPYGQPGYGSLETLAAITPQDLKAYLNDHIGRDQLIVTATGDIKPAELGPFIDKIFGDLPEKSVPFTISEIQPQAVGQTFVVEKPIPETVLILGSAGPKRDDPDWYAAEIMNYILGGGGFNSRLMEEVRAKQALTYGIGSSLVPYKHAGLIIINASTKNEDAAKALALTKAEIKRMAEKGISDTELKEAKTYLTGSIPLELTSTSSVAQALLSLRFDNLPSTFLNDVAAKLNSVSKADVARVSQRYLIPDNFTAVILGQPQNVKASAPLPE